MQSVGRKLAFVLASSNHGTMIVNRLDYRMVDQTRGFGVGFQLLETASFDPQEVKLALDMLTLRRKHYGDGVIGIDCGAKIGFLLANIAYGLAHEELAPTLRTELARLLAT